MTAYRGDVDARHLSSEQRERIYRSLYPATNYLVRLTKRMERVGWHRQDPVYVHAMVAHEELVRLSMAINNAGTLHAWEPPEERRPRPPEPGTPPVANGGAEEKTATGRRSVTPLS